MQERTPSSGLWVTSPSYLPTHITELIVGRRERSGPLCLARTQLSLVEIERQEHRALSVEGVMATGKLSLTGARARTHSPF